MTVAYHVHARTPNHRRARLIRVILTVPVLALAVVTTQLAGIPLAAATSGVPFGQLEHVTDVASGVHVSGWAIDPDTTKPISVVVTDNGHRLGVLVASVPRTSVARDYAGFGAKHGFDQTFTLASGAHTVCVTADNVGPNGSDKSLGCRLRHLTSRPIGAVAAVTAGVGGIHLSGWALDPDTIRPVTIGVYLDGRPTASLWSGQSAPSAAVFPLASAGHGFSGVVGATAGTHQVCLRTPDVSAGGRVTTTLTTIGCRAVTVAVSPVGLLHSIRHRAGSATISVPGWAVDPQTDAAITVSVTVDGRPRGTVSAGQPWYGLVTPYAGISIRHGFHYPIAVSAGAHEVCATALNVMAGTDTSLGCVGVAPAGATAPTPPLAVTAKAAPAGAVVSWTPPRTNGGTPVTGYAITSTPVTRTIVVAPTAVSATVHGLVPGRSYTFTMTATNLVGPSAPALASAPVRPTAALVTSPPLISTSRYIRNIHGDSASDRAKTAAMGAADAAANPSGHSYLALLQIGGQDRHGIVLSATSTYVSYTEAVNALKAYVDAYAAHQHADAPATIAIGTNNDMHVSSFYGALWADQMVDPLRTYARRYANLSIVGADDMEPGFLGSATQTKAWLAGYLGATSARFVFNGSADGCGWTRAHTGCNNGWRATTLGWLAGGAAKSRILSLPQIYNHTMPRQWKYISLTDIDNHAVRLNFAGPLTEYTACVRQHGGCTSLTNNVAWTALWQALQSDLRVSQPSLPYGTDLRIN